VRPIKLINESKHSERIVNEQLYKVLKGNTSFGDGTNTDNISGGWYTVVTPVTPDTQFSITHNLNIVPSGYIVMSRNKAAIVYDSGTAWTATQIFLKCNVASTTIKIFIIT
jgi:hypothetical protein